MTQPSVVLRYVELLTIIVLTLLACTFALTKNIASNGGNEAPQEKGLIRKSSFSNWSHKTSYENSQEQQVSVLVTGRAIDDRFRPVSDAIVTLYSRPCRDCIDHVFPVGSSQRDGTFFVEFTGRPYERLTLFIETPEPRSSWAPLSYPPFERLARSRQVRGYEIRAEIGRGQIDLGNVPVSIRYSKLLIDLASILADYKPNENAAEQVGMSIRDRNTLIYQGAVPPKAFDSRFASLNLALTKGKWKIELYLLDDEKASRKTLSVKLDNADCKTIAFVNGKQLEKPCK